MTRFETMDILKFLPDTPKILGKLAETKLLTHGHTSNGKMTCALVWQHGDEHRAFFGFNNPCVPNECYTSDTIVECSFLEAMQDAWLHHYAIMVEGKLIWDGRGFIPEFELLHHASDEHEFSQRAVKKMLARIRTTVRLAQVRLTWLYNATRASAANWRTAFPRWLFRVGMSGLELLLTLQCRLASFRQRPGCWLFGCVLSAVPACDRCGTDLYGGPFISRGTLKRHTQNSIERLQRLGEQILHKCDVCGKWTPFSVDPCCSKKCFDNWLPF